MKKDFKNSNPALSYITEQPERNTEQLEDIPMKLNPLYIETKSKRLQLLIKPSIHTKLKDIAATKGTSLNELINEALGDYVKKEGEYERD